jgi:hypothetical protein
MSRVERHEEKLRRHFSGKRVGDISTLISETKSISYLLKRSGRRKRANQFDSYIDVLTYGNRTMDESLDDVMRLVNRGTGNAGAGNTDAENAGANSCKNIFFVEWLP